METSRIVDILILAEYPLMSYGFSYVAIFLMKKLIAMNDKLSLEMALELSAMLREAGKYKDMLDFAENAFKNLDADHDLFNFSLFKIRYAEALALNGRHNYAIITLNEIFSKRDQFTGACISYKDSIRNTSNFVLTENEKSLENNAMPLRVSVLANMASASLRIGEYCLVEKYLEELFNTEKEFFKKEISTDMLLQLNDMYMKAIMKCSSM